MVVWGGKLKDQNGLEPLIYNIFHMDKITGLKLALSTLKCLVNLFFSIFIGPSTSCFQSRLETELLKYQGKQLSLN